MPSLGTIWAEVGLNTQKLNAGLADAQLKFASADKQVNTMAQKWSANSTKMLMAGGVMVGAVAAVGVASIKMAKDFDTSMRNVNSIAKLSETEFKNLSGEVLDLSRKVPQSAKVLADGLYDIASSGFAGADGMKVLEASAKAASAGMTDTATSAKGITAVLNAYGMEAEDAAAVSDTMFATVDKGVITFEELSGGIGNVISTANLANIEFNELSGMIAYMTTKGVSAEETMTALNRLILSIIDPTEQLAAVLKSAGYESGEAAIEALGLTGVLDLMDKAAGGSLTKLQEMSPEMRALKASGALLGSGIKELNEFMKDFKDTTGATNTALAEQSKALDYQLDILKNNVSAVAIALGTKYIPSITGITTTISKYISTNNEAISSTIDFGLKAVASIGGILLLTGAIGKLRGILMTPIGKAGGLAAGLVAVGIGIDELAKKLDSLDTKWGEFGEASVSALKPLQATTGGFKDNIVVAQALADGLIKLDDVRNLNVFTMEKTLKKIEELRATQEEAADATDDAAARHLFFNNAVKESRDVIDDYTPSVEEAADATEDLAQEVKSLTDELFKLYNINQSVTELTWDFSDAVNKANEVLKDKNSTDREQQEALFGVQDAYEELTATIEENLKSGELTHAQQYQLQKDFIESGSQAVELGIITKTEFENMAKNLGINVEKMGGSFAKIKSDADNASVGVKSLRDYINSLESKEITITAVHRDYYEEATYKPGNLSSGGIIGMAGGGIIGSDGAIQPKLSAASGLIAPQTGRAIPVLAHEGEVILNSGQQANLAQAIWGVANGKSGGGITVNLTINSPDPITPDEVARQTKNALRLYGMEAAL